MSIRVGHSIFGTAIAVGALAVFQVGAAAQATSPRPAAAAGPASDANVFEVTAEDYAFRAPAEIPSGWTTVRFANQGEEHHFVFLSRLPEGKNIHNYETELSAQFNNVWYAIRDEGLGMDEAMGMLGESLPEWFAAVDFVGGPGIVAPGLTSETTVNLEPGNYVMECYLKTADGEFHYMEGMVRPFVVTEDRSEATPPQADIQVTVSNFEMVVEGDLTPGEHTVAVHVAENPEEGFGHSAHLARLDSDADVDQLVQWMNAFGIDGLRTPAPAQFLGGTHGMPAGNTAYTTMTLEPGRYLWLSEATAHQGVLKEFTVR